MKFSFMKVFCVVAVFLSLMLATCSGLFTEETREGYFTISLSANENARAVYPPTDFNGLKLTVNFKNSTSGAVTTFTADGSGSIQGKIDIGDYTVTMGVTLISDGSSYARGIAYDNPVTIGSGQNPIKVYAYDVNSADPPVISAKPHGRPYSLGATEPALEVSATVTDGGVLSYQWYSNTSDNIPGSSITGATSSRYMPSTSTPGTTWYYVVITNTSTGNASTINTVPVPIGVDLRPGTGTIDDPFLVYDVASLQKVGSETDGWSSRAHYKQIEDIDLASVANWIPIGINGHGSNAYVQPFSGSYDGNGKTISNLTINAPTEDLQGLFGAIAGSDGPVLKNIGLVNCIIVGNEHVGGVVGAMASTGTVQNCYVTGSVSGGNNVGGVVGENNGTVQDCYATGDVFGNDNVGGVVGDNEGIVQDCYATGVITGLGLIGGGVVGLNYGGTVQNCYATGDVSGNMHFGGVVGYNYEGTVQNCYATGGVSGGLHTVGGVVGNNYEGTVQNCYATGDVSGNRYVGGVVGVNKDGTVQDCYATGDVSGNDDVGGVVGVNRDGTVQDCYATGNVSGNGSVGGVVGSNIGTVQNCHATGNVSGGDNPGVGGVVGRNDGLLQYCYATGNVSGGAYVGGVVGVNSGTVQYCYSTGNVTTEIYSAGGVVGYNEKGTVQNCYTTGNVSSFVIAGGVVGDNKGTVQNCYATGNVSGSIVGGVAGINYDGTIKYCYSTGSVSDNSIAINAWLVGGVVGSIEIVEIHQVATLQNCVALNQDVSTGGPHIGRVLGYLSDVHGLTTFANNYGRDDMKMNGGSPTWTNIGPNDLDGASITSAYWGIQSWWTTAGNWDTAGWDFTEVWRWGGSLPILRNMPGTATQNPAVKP